MKVSGLEVGLNKKELKRSKARTTFFNIKKAMNFAYRVQLRVLCVSQNKHRLRSLTKPYYSLNQH
jgi:hypothetical protein